LVLSPTAFISKWLNSPIKERAAAQEHFLDLCRMLGEPTPAEIDPTGRDYGFEVGASKTTGGNGFADVFKRGHFGWEYKGTKANLDTAFAQLQRYAVALDNPPLLIVSDIGTTIRIHTNWTNSVSKVYEIAIADLGDPEKRGWLKSALSDPEALRPTKTRQQLTEEVAGEFAQLARSLRERGHKAGDVAHFINRLVFCMFAEDVKLLPDTIFTRMLERALEDPSEFESFAADLFRAMKSGGRVGFEKVAWFNGGLFNDDQAFALTKEEIRLVHRAAQQYWGDIDPSILGTLFERGLDPDKRSQLGAHYTDRDKIMMIINPVIVEPLTEEWEAAKAEIADHMAKAAASKGAPATRATNNAQAVLQRHLQRLADYRVLDPACGSGNFLYLALRALKDLEHRAQVEAEAMGLPRGFPQIGPEVVKGIEINPYAAELARVSVWIGEIQWMIKNGFAASTNPVLKPLETIECRDALLMRDDALGSTDGGWLRANWPDATAIVGNPPFLGDKKMIRELGEEYVSALRSLYSGDVPGGADLVAYWFAKALEATARSNCLAGLVSTNSIRSGRNRKVLDRIAEAGTIFNAWSDEPWVVEGASVRVSLVCFGAQVQTPACLDGRSVALISSDLTSSPLVASQLVRLEENARVAFTGVFINGQFEISGDLAREWLREPTNVNGRPNSDVLRPTMNGSDLLQRGNEKWLVDFGTDLSVEEAAHYEEPFSYVERNVKPFRTRRDESGNYVVRRVNHRELWWRFAEARPGMRRAMEGLARIIVTPMVSSTRVFAFLPASYLPNQKLVVLTRDDDSFFGILSSRFHHLWTLATCSWIGAGNDVSYSSTNVFETFPFPEGLTPNIPASHYSADGRAIAVAAAAQRLNSLRENWLNPPDLVRIEPEVTAGYPARTLPLSEEAAQTLKKRTLTNLYNERPTWLQNAHKALDDAVAAAYGWPSDLTDDEVLARLFALNQERSV
jgi:type II restriction/modification system DNA methylase subunit YeeA